MSEWPKGVRLRGAPCSCVRVVDVRVWAGVVGGGRDLVELASMSVLVTAGLVVTSLKVPLFYPPVLHIMLVFFLITMMIPLCGCRDTLWGFLFEGGYPVGIINSAGAK